MRVRLVVNPAARRGAQLGDTVAAQLRRLGIDVIAGESSAGSLDAIVVAGGDGTFAGQIPRALAIGLPIGLVPLGTFNDLARSLEIPFNVEAACAVIAAGRTRPIDVARVNDAYYATEASIGVSSRIARLQRPEGKQRFGFWAILASLSAVARHARPFHAEIAFEGRRERVRAVQVTVANSQHFGGIITVGDAAIDDLARLLLRASRYDFRSFLGRASDHDRAAWLRPGLANVSGAQFRRPYAPWASHYCRRRAGRQNAGTL